MAGRRMIDVVRLLGAARDTSLQHLLLRRQQLEVFNQTSSVWKILQSKGHQFSQNASANSSRSGKSSLGASKTEKNSPTIQTTNPGEDVFYDRSQSHASEDPVPSKSMNVHQDTMSEEPLPDGTIPPVNSSVAEEMHQDNRSNPTPQELSQAQHARQSQRQSESPIPSVEAEPPELAVEQDSDTYHTSAADSNPVLSSLPRTKVPKASANLQTSDEHVPDKDINQDVFYSSKPDVNGQSRNENNEDLPKEIYTDLFHSRNVAGKLTGQTTPYQLKNRLPKHQDTTSDTRHPLDTRPVVKTEETEQLVIDSAKDAAKSPSVSFVRQGVNFTDRLTGCKQIEESIAVGPLKQFKLRESRVPSSRFGRIWEYSRLATSMAFGAVGESFRRATGSSTTIGGSSMLSGANIERLVSKLSRMRGAALKLGQMMSFQGKQIIDESAGH